MTFSFVSDVKLEMRLKSEIGQFVRDNICMHTYHCDVG